MDFLHALDQELPDSLMERVYNHSHNVWETAIWAQVSNRCLVRRGDQTYRIIPVDEVIATDTILPNELKPCNIYVQENGGFSFEFTSESTNFWMYERGDSYENERALIEALPHLYLSFKP
jgi:hypothetical protein